LLVAQNHKHQTSRIVLQARRLPKANCVQLYQNNHFESLTGNVIKSTSEVKEKETTRGILRKIQECAAQSYKFRFLA
jgi:hypothetical protein